MTACPLNDAVQVTELLAAAGRIDPCPDEFFEPQHMEEMRTRLKSLVLHPHTKLFEDENYFCHHWDWRGPTNKDGMRFITVRGLQMEARRVSWSFHRRPIPDGKFPRPACGWKFCLRPEHLRLFVRASGRIKLGWREKLDIMKCRGGGESVATAAVRLGVSRETIYLVIRAAEAGEKEGKDWLAVFRDAPR